MQQNVLGVGLNLVTLLRWRSWQFLRNVLLAWTAYVAFPLHAIAGPIPFFIFPTPGTYGLAAGVYNYPVEPSHVYIDAFAETSTSYGIMFERAEWYSDTSSGIASNFGYTYQVLDFFTLPIAMPILHHFSAEGRIAGGAGNDSSLYANFTVYSYIYDENGGTVVSDIRKHYTLQLAAGELEFLDVNFVDEAWVTLNFPLTGIVPKYLWAQGIIFDYSYTGPDAVFTFDFAEKYGNLTDGGLRSIVCELGCVLSLPEPSSLYLLFAGLIPLSISGRWFRRTISARTSRNCRPRVPHRWTRNQSPETPRERAVSAAIAQSTL
jgi:hypothetical protein